MKIRRFLLRLMKLCQFTAAQTRTPPALAAGFGNESFFEKKQPGQEKIAAPSLVC
jgi:hypothetical protein